MSTDLTDSTDHERALIGKLLFSPEQLEEVIEWLRPGAFGNGRCRECYEAMVTCWFHRMPANLATIDFGFDKNGVERARIDWVDLTAMMANLPWGADAVHYARLVIEAAKRRVLVGFGSEMVAQGYSNADFDYQTAYTKAMGQIEALTPTEDGPVLLADLLPPFQEKLQAAWAGEDAELVIATGFRALDRDLYGGLRPGDLCVVGGRPGSGKTAFALQVALNHARRKRGDVLMFSAEMSTKSVLGRLIANMSDTPARNLYARDLNPEKYNHVLHALDQAADFHLALDATAGITTDQMAARVDRHRKRRSVDLVIFDFLELARDAIGTDSEEQRVAAIARGMKALAVGCDVAVILLSQLSREVERRTNKIPIMSDLRYSGSVEAAADEIMFLYREAYYVAQGIIEHPTPGKEDTCDVHLAKHREGKTGNYAIRFDPEITRFVDIDETAWRRLG